MRAWAENSFALLQVRARDDEGCIAFIRDILRRAVVTENDKAALQDAVCLMGYANPVSSPYGQMMSQQVTNHILSRTEECINQDVPCWDVPAMFPGQKQVLA